MPVLPSVTVSEAENFDRGVCSASAFSRFLPVSHAAPKTVAERTRNSRRCIKPPAALDHSMILRRPIKPPRLKFKRLSSQKHRQNKTRTSEDFLCVSGEKLCASFKLLAKRRQLLLYSRHLFLKLRHFTLQDAEAITARGSLCSARRFRANRVAGKQMHVA